MTGIMVHPNESTVYPDSSPQSLLTVTDIIRLKADFEADVRLAEELPARIKLKRRKYEAALMFAPPGFDPNAMVFKRSDVEQEAPKVAEQESVPALPATQTNGEQPQEQERKRMTWIGELSRVLDVSTRGLPHREVLETLKATELGGRPSEGDKGFYGAVARLEKKGRLVKNGGLLYSAKLVAQMKAQGEELPDMSLEARRRSGGSAAVVLQVLRESPDGMDAAQIRDAVGGLPGMPGSIAKHAHYIYNVLAPLIGQAEVTKDAQGIYRVREAH